MKLLDCKVTPKPDYGAMVAPKHKTHSSKNSRSKQSASKLCQAIVLTAVAAQNCSRVKAVQTAHMNAPPEGEENKNIRLLQVEFEPFALSFGSTQMWVGAKNKGANLVEAGLTEDKCLRLQKSYQQLAALAGEVKTFPYRNKDRWDDPYYFFDISNQFPIDKFFCLNEETGEILETHKHV